MSLERDSFAAMAAFLATVEEGSFSGAATKLGLTPSGVSKLVGRLEGRLGVRLFQRTTRQMRLTHSGDIYFERSRRIFDDLRSLDDAIAVSDDVPRGLLRVTAPVVLGHVRVFPAVSAFHQAFPTSKIDLLLVDRVVDLIEERIDVAVRMTASPPLSYVAKKLGEDARVLCASPGYLARRGRPGRPQDLKEHDCLAFIPGTADGTPATWKLRTDSGKPVAIRVCGRLHTNSIFSLHEAALDGLGIADLPSYLVDKDLRAGRLEAVLHDFIAFDRSVYAVYAPGRSVPARIREFVKLLVAQFAGAATAEIVPHVRAAGRRR
jgi:DNA-binding transcriptional LysR family regulator